MLKKNILVSVLALSLFAAVAHADTGTTVFQSQPAPAPNVYSLSYQSTETAEFGDEVSLAGTARKAGSVTVTMSEWAKHSDFPSMPAAGFSEPITLNIYSTQADAISHTPFKTITTTFTIPWRPEADPSCTPAGDWLASDGQCYAGYAFPITFDLRPLNFDFPDQFIYGIAYNTGSWGYAPLGVAGPYDSLNVGLNDDPSTIIGTDVNPDEVYWNTKYAPFYSDGGVAGVGVLRPDDGWTPDSPAVTFSAFAVPTVANDCKNDGWKSLVQDDFTTFKNQGACVSYVQLTNILTKIQNLKNNNKGNEKRIKLTNRLGKIFHKINGK